MVVTEIFLATGFILFIGWVFYIDYQNRRFFKNIPGPPLVFFLGNLLELSSPRVSLDILHLMMKYCSNYGKLSYIIAPLRYGLIVTDYELLEKVLSSNKIISKTKEYEFLSPWLGTGLLTSDGLKWKQHRKVLTPAFHFQILEKFIEVFESAGSKLVQKLESEANNSSLDIYPYVTLCTLDIICESAMGTKLNAQDNDHSEYVLSVKNMTKLIIERTLHVLQNFDLTFPLTKNYYVQKKALKILHRYTNDVINSRRREVEQKRKDRIVNGDDTSATKKRKAFLDLLLEAEIDGKPLTHEEIREEVDTFMFEGHDTTASAISFALYSLANNPDAQNKALDEQKSLFGDNQTPQITYADLQNMKYLEWVIKETLRLYPSVPFYGRRVKEPIEHKGTILPVGTELCLFPYGIHRDPEYFKNPDKFDPSRFENLDSRYPYAYIPFSAGARNCIGQKFAMLEMKSTISKIIRKFELFPAIPQHDLQLVPESVLKSANGVKIGLRLRHW